MVPGAMVELGVVVVVPLPLRRLREPAAGAAARGGGSTPGAFSASAGALHTLRGPQGHHLALELLQFLIADGLSRLALQGCADLVVRDPAAVLRDQSDQVVDEVGEVGHRCGVETLGWGSGKQSLGLARGPEPG